MDHQREDVYDIFSDIMLFLFNVDSMAILIRDENNFRYIENDIDAIRKIPKMDIEPLSKSVPDIPEELNRIVMKCLEKQKDNRYQSAAAVSADLLTLKKEQKMAFDASDLADFMTKTFKPNNNSSQSK